MKNYGLTILSLLFFIYGFVVIFEVLFTGSYERALGNTGVPAILDIGAAVFMLFIGFTGLKAFWRDLTRKKDKDPDHK